MSPSLRAALVAASALVSLASAGCAELTRPDEIIILAEPPPAPKAPIAAATPQGEDAENVITTQLGSRARGTPKAAGGG